MVDWTSISGVINVVLLMLALLFSVKWKLFKAKLSALKEFIDALDAALADDKVTDEEFSRLFDTFRRFFQKAIS